MMNIKKSLSLALLIFVTINAVAQTSWVLRSNTNGIKVFTGSFANSKYKAIKVECVYNASPAQITAVLLDVNTCTEWVYHTKSIKLLKEPAPNEVYYYSEVSLPWPASNRDFTAHLTATQNPETKVVTVDGPAVDGLVPVREGIVRVTESTGKWIITPIEGGRSKVEYTLHVNPAGALPAWLVNMFATEGPTKSFEGLRNQLQKPQFKNVSLAFIKN